ncbi:MAG: Holliday junction branch migration protein RuvA, partial [Peptococcaceae bacterium]|nr:Holliday junction branch migration protein RuvA [Peptococcaceae bacterium]
KAFSGELYVPLSGEAGVRAEAAEALVALGYSAAEAKAALGKVLGLDQGTTDVAELIKLALKQLR